jgi:hypothetical protein
MHRTRASKSLAAVLLAVGLLGPSLASAKPSPEPRAKAVEGMMIIWSGANKREQADQQLLDAQQLVGLFDKYLEGGAASLEVFESAKVSGLKPGFFVVSLGVCPADEVGEVLGVFQAIYPDVYAKPVKYRPSDELPAATCPRLAVASEAGESGAKRWQIERSESRMIGAARLSALVFSYTDSTSGDFLREYAGLEAVFVLTDPRKRTVLASAAYRGPSNWTKLQEMAEAGSGYELQLQFADPPCDPGGDDHFADYEQTIAVRVAKNAISVREGKRKLNKEGECGYAAEDRMMQGRHDEEETGD